MTISSDTARRRLDQWLQIIDAPALALERGLKPHRYATFDGTVAEMGGFHVTFRDMNEALFYPRALDAAPQNGVKLPLGQGQPFQSVTTGFLEVLDSFQKDQGTISQDIQTKMDQLDDPARRTLRQTNRLVRDMELPETRPASPPPNLQAILETIVSQFGKPENAKLQFLTYEEKEVVQRAFKDKSAEEINEQLAEQFTGVTKEQRNTLKKRIQSILDASTGTSKKGGGPGKDSDETSVYYLFHPDKLYDAYVDAMAVTDNSMQVEEKTMSILSQLQAANDGVYAYVYTVVDGKAVAIDLLTAATPTEVATHLKPQLPHIPEWLLGGGPMQKYAVGGAVWTGLAKKVKVYSCADHAIDVESAVAAQLVVGQRMPLHPTSGYQLLFSKFKALPPVVGVYAETPIDTPRPDLIDVLCLTGPVLRDGHPDATLREDELRHRVQECFSLVMHAATVAKKRRVVMPPLGGPHFREALEAARRAYPKMEFVVVDGPPPLDSPLHTLFVHDWGSDMCVGAEATFYGTHTALAFLCLPAVNEYMRGEELDCAEPFSATSVAEAEAVAEPMRPAKPNDYRVLTGKLDGLAAFASAANTLVADDYVPCGGMVLHDNEVHQPFLRLQITESDVAAFWTNYKAYQTHMLANVDVKLDEREANLGWFRVLGGGSGDLKTTKHELTALNAVR